MWDIMEQGSDVKAARNRASKKWRASFKRCDGGSRERVGSGWLGGQGDAACARAAGGLRTSTAADAGDVCSDGVKGWKRLQHLKGREVG